MSQFGMLWSFSKQAPRLEIVFEKEVPAYALTALKAYAPKKEAKMLTIEGKGRSIFFADEAAEMLKHAGTEDFAINDRTQALRLAYQSMGIFVFALEIIAFVVLLKYLFRDINRLLRKYQASLNDMYMKETFAQHIEITLASIIKWIIIIIMIALVLRRIVVFEFFIPSRLLPTEYILDYKYYFGLQMSAISHSSYEQLCKIVLPGVYALCAANIGLTTFLSCKIWRKATKKSSGGTYGTSNNEKFEQGLPKHN